jgi:hypothetical protein
VFGEPHLQRPTRPSRYEILKEVPPCFLQLPAPSLLCSLRFATPTCGLCCKAYPTDRRCTSYVIYRPRAASGKVRLCTKRYGLGEIFTTLVLGLPRCCGDSHHNDAIAPSFRRQHGGDGIQFLFSGPANFSISPVLYGQIRAAMMSHCGYRGTC